MPLGGIFLAVRIRLQRHGRKKRPFYRLVAADARAQRDGVFLERLGHYNPMTEPADVFIDEEKALKWLRRGAQPSDTAKRLLTQNGILMKFEYEKLGKPMPEQEADEEVAKTDDLEPTETQEVASETDTPPTEATPESVEAPESESTEEEE
jgi:small subunit ribosomal protein S16